MIYEIHALALHEHCDGARFGRFEKAVEFYEHTLGLQKKYRFADYAGFDCGGVEIGIKTWGENEPPRAGEPCLNFLVDDVQEMYKSLRNNGVNFINPPKHTRWGGKIALFSDPDGNLIQLTEIDWDKYFNTCAMGG